VTAFETPKILLVQDPHVFDASLFDATPLRHLQNRFGDATIEYATILGRRAHQRRGNEEVKKRRETGHRNGHRIPVPGHAEHLYQVLAPQVVLVVVVLVGADVIFSVFVSFFDVGAEPAQHLELDVLSPNFFTSVIHFIGERKVRFVQRSAVHRYSMVSA
jgi:hypothetical protein